MVIKYELIQLIQLESMIDKWDSAGFCPKMRVYPKIVVWMLSGWWLSHPSEKYESQMGLLFPIYGKMFQTTNQLL